MPEDDLFKYKYLIDAKKNIDEAVAIAEADIRDKDEIARVLAEAGEKACEALTLLEKDSEYWAQLRKPTKDLVRKAVPIHTLYTAEAMDLLTRARPTDDSAVHDVLGVTYRPAIETATALISGLYHGGRLTARQAGKAARPGALPPT